jgi:guanylate kinase
MSSDARRENAGEPRAPRGKLVVLSAPSGTGKTTIAREIMNRIPSLQFSVSATTRPARPGEVDGSDYFFLTRDEFRRRVDAGEFVEWEELYGDYYGTLRSETDRALHQGRHLLFDVDVKGGLSIRRSYPEAILIFLRPVNVHVLEERLRNRHTENDVAMTRRLERVPMELEQGDLFDYQVVNDQLPQAVAEVQKIIEHHLSHS